VAVTAPVAVTFTEAVNPLTVTTNSVNVQANGNTVAGTYAVSGSTVTFTPLTALPGSAAISVCVGCYAPVQDVAGNSGGAASSGFTTAATVDTTAPTVAMVTPSNKATGIGLSGQVAIVFSKSMNPATLTASNLALLAGGQPQPFGVSVSADNRTVVLSNLNLPASTTITLSVSPAVTDLSGNALTAFTSVFTTGAGFDTTHGSVVNQRPGNGATGVALNASPVVLFVSKPLNAGTVSGALHISENGQLISGTAALAGDGQTIAFTPSSPWQYGALVQVFLDATAEDTDGNAVTAYQGSFTTVGDPSSTAPAVVNYSPQNGAQNVPLNAVMDIGYSEPLSASTVNGTNVVLYDPSGNPVTATVTLDATGTVIHLKPGSALAANAQYCFVASGLQGVNGLAAQSQYDYYCFTTGTSAAAAAPTVLAVSPLNNLVNVPLNADIGVEFSAPVDPLTVTGTTIQVSGGGTTSVPASISFTNNNQRVEITPQAPLPASTAMTLTVSGVTDVAGNAVAAQTTHFTTGSSPATASPYVLAVNPPANASEVPVNAALSLQASTALDATTVTSGSYQVYDNTLSTYVSGAYSESADGTTVYFLPSSPLATGRTYSVSFIGQGMTDLAGNQLTGAGVSNFSFTTGFSAGTSAPQVTGVSPSNGLTQVPINAEITVQFNEPVDAESLSGVTLSAAGSAVPVTATLSAGNQSMTVVPGPGLLAATAYTLTVAGVTDLSGNVMSAAFTSTFTTGNAPDLVAPTVISVIPNTGATGVTTSSVIQIQFNKFMNSLSVTNSNVTVTTNGNSFVSGTISANQDGSIITFTPVGTLAPLTAYSINLGSGIIDLEGESLQTFQSTFTTGSQ
jgi:hypothetical protein